LFEPLFGPRTRRAPSPHEHLRAAGRAGVGGVARGSGSGSSRAPPPPPLPPPSRGGGSRTPLPAREKRGERAVQVPIYLNEKDVAEFLDMPTAITALRDAFAARARNEGNVIPRTRWAFGERRLNVMGGGLATQRRFAVKCYGSSAFHVLLYSEQDGLLAVIEANVLGQIRTGAASAVASEKMARPNSRKVALIGTGRQARTQALALGCAGLLKELAVFARSRDKLEAFCARLGPELNAAAHPARSAEEAVADADIVTAATNSVTPVVMASWLKT